MINLLIVVKIKTCSLRLPYGLYLVDDTSRQYVSTLLYKIYNTLILYLRTTQWAIYYVTCQKRVTVYRLKRFVVFVTPCVPRSNRNIQCLLK